MSTKVSASFQATGVTVQKVEFYNGDYEKLGETSTLDSQNLYSILVPLAADIYNLKSVVYTNVGSIESPVVTRRINPLVPYNPVPVSLVDPVTPDSGWDSIPAKQINNVILGSALNSIYDISGFWKARYDDNNLNLYIRVYDDTIKKDGTGDFNDDSVEVFISPTRNTTGTYLSTDRSYRIDVVAGTIVEVRGNPNTATCKVVLNNGEYFVMLRCPLSNLGFSATNTPEDKVIGIEVQINDDDDGGTRDNKVAWFATADNVFNNPANMGQGKIAAKPVQQTNVCTITSPLTGSRFERDSQIQIIATASEYNTSVSKVEFFVNTVKIGEQSQKGAGNTYSFVYTASNVRTDQVVAKVTYLNGSQISSPAISLTIVELNQINITSPASNIPLISGSTVDIIVTPITNISQINFIDVYIRPEGDSSPDAYDRIETAEGNGTYKTTWQPSTPGNFIISASAAYTSGLSRSAPSLNIAITSTPSTGGGVTTDPTTPLPNQFNISGGKILSPLGTQVITKGIHIPGLNSASLRDVTLDIDLIDKVWKFNTVFLDCKLVPGAESQTINNDINKIITAFTDRKIIVVIGLLDLANSYVTDTSTPNLTTAATFLKNLASTYKNNPYVWFNPFFRPGSAGLATTQWKVSHQAVIQAIRDEAGANNVIICSGSAGGQDLGGLNQDIIVTPNSAILSFGDELKTFNSKVYSNLAYGLIISDQWVQNTSAKLQLFSTLCSQQNKALVVTSITSSTGTASTYGAVVPALVVLKERFTGRAAASWEGLNNNALTTAVGGGGYLVNRVTGSKPSNLTAYGNAVWDDVRDFTSALNTPVPVTPGATGTANLNVVNYRIVEDNSAIGQTVTAEVVIKNVGTASSAERYLAYTIYIRGYAVATAGAVISLAPNQTITLVSNPFVLSRSIADVAIRQIN